MSVRIPLTMNGTGQIQQLQSADQLSTGGLLATGTVSNAAAINCNFSGFVSSGFKIFEIEFWDIIPVTNSVNLWLRTSPNGTTPDTGATNYMYAGFFANAASAAAGATYGSFGVEQGTGAAFCLLASGITNTASQGATSLRALIRNPFATVQYKTIRTETELANPLTSNPAIFAAANVRLSTAVVEGIHLLMSTGNISGNYAIYGR